MAPEDDTATDAPEGEASSLAQDWGSALAEQSGEQGNAGAAAKWASMVDGADASDINADRLMNQDEIDQILGFKETEAALSGANGVRAIADTGKVSHERLPMLEIVSDRIVRLLSTSLRNFFSDNVEVTLESITSVRFGDYLNSIPLPALLAVVKAQEWDNLALVTVESTLTYSALDVLLGGRRGSAASFDGRAFTTIETRLMRRMVEVVLGDAETAFQPLSPVHFTVDRIETNPRFAMITRPANAAILIELRFDMEGRGGKLQLLLPYATIEPIRDLLLQSFMGEKLGRDPVWEGHLATEIWQADIALEAVLHETKIPLKRLLALEVGDTIMFDAKPDTLVTLRCGDLFMGEGRIGRIDDHVAVQLARPLVRSYTTLAAFEASATRRTTP